MAPNECHFTVFSEDVAFAFPFMSTHSPPTLSPCRSASGIGYTRKNIYNGGQFSYIAIHSMDGG